MKRIPVLGTVIFAVAFAAYLYAGQAPNRATRTTRWTENIGPFKNFDNILLIGEPAPDFTLQTPDGESVTLSDLRGKVVVLEFGART